MPGTLLERLEANRAKRANPTPPKIVSLYPSTLPMSPFVRAAREKRLAPAAIGYSPDGCGPTGRAA